MTDDDVGGLVSRFYARLWNAWDDDAVDTTLAPAFAFRGSLGEETAGRDAWRGYRDRVRAAAPDFQVQVLEMVVAGDRAAVRLECTGHQRGTLVGIAPTGRPFRYPAAAFLRAGNGLLVRAWVLGDLDSLRAQLRQPQNRSG